MSTGRLNGAVKRNIERFPQDFMLRLSDAEYAAVISQFATSKPGRGGRRKLPALGASPSTARSSPPTFSTPLYAIQLRMEVLVKESFDRRVSMPPIMLPYESVLCPRVNHHIEGFAQVLQCAE